MTQKDAAIKAGYSPKNPDQSAHQALQQIKRRVPDVMDQLGLTDEILIAKHLIPLLKAKATKFFQLSGHVTEIREVPALGTRIAALDMAFKLKGSYAPKQIDLDPAKTRFKVINVGNFPPRKHAT